MSADNRQSVKYSVVFLLDKENANFKIFYESVVNICTSRQDSFEVIIVANGTGGFLRELLEEELQAGKLKAIEMDSRTSKAICMKSVLKESSGQYILAFGAYQQLTNNSINKILDSIDNETDIISPWRLNRSDPFFYRLQSKIFNTAVRWIAGSTPHDLSCNVSVFRREVLEKTDLYGNMYRFLPIYAAQKGFSCKEVKCEHNKEHGEPRSAKAGFYHLFIYINRIIDMFTLYFNTSFSKKPLRFFIGLGALFIIVGILISLAILLKKMSYGYPVGDNPSLLLAAFFMLIGIQSASVGLLGEIIVFTYGRMKKDFVIEKII